MYKVLSLGVAAHKCMHHIARSPRVLSNTRVARRRARLCGPLACGAIIVVLLLLADIPHAFLRLRQNVLRQ